MHFAGAIWRALKFNFPAPSTLYQPVPLHDPCEDVCRYTKQLEAKPASENQGAIATEIV